VDHTTKADANQVRGLRSPVVSAYRQREEGDRVNLPGGPRPFRFNHEVEIGNHKTPKTWVRGAL
jgi:hypothetical protein